jgi:putative membrane protein
LKLLVYAAGLAGISLLIALVVGSDVPALLDTALQGGYQLLWLLPYRTSFFLLYAAGWLVLLRPYDEARRVGIGYLFWVSTVREAIDRLLPVASVGGAVAGVRLVGWRGIPATPASATVIVEIVLTLIASWLFAVLGVALLSHFKTGSENYHSVVLALLLSLPVPLVLTATLGSGALFGRLERLLARFVGISTSPAGAAALDAALRSTLRLNARLVSAGVLQLLALISGAVEIWFALRLFGHPVGVGAALMLESMVQAFRHVAFMVPASLGVQETVLVVFGHSLGIGTETAIAVSLVKRLREVIWGVASLLSWQWMEGRRLRAPLQNLS